MRIFHKVALPAVIAIAASAVWIARHDSSSNQTTLASATPAPPSERIAADSAPVRDSRNATSKAKAPPKRVSAAVPVDPPATIPWNAVLDHVVAIYRNKSAKSESEAASDAQSVADLDQAVARDPAVRRGLIQRWQLGSDQLERRTIITILSRHPSPETAAFSRQLIASDDATERRGGFELLLAGPRGAQTYQSLAQALAREQDPTIVTGVVATLAKSTNGPTTYSAPLIERLLALAQGDDTAIRRASLQALAHGDPSARTDSVLEQALFDSHEEIRIAAALSAGINPERAQSMKPELTAVARDTQETAGVRFAALSTLQTLTLTSEETAAVAQIARELKGR